ncbi:MAG: hypothetical protein GF311_06410, partial [Candidatus Lokiarchaeota archaeon]|nr:hypothetical protein [Candidatus Lokiarchaeota archaeon]
MLRDELLKIKNIANQIKMHLDQEPEDYKLSKYLKHYEKKYWDKILLFTQNFYNTSPLDIKTIETPRFSNSRTQGIGFEEEYELILSKNRRIREEFIQLLYLYREQYLSNNILEAEQCYEPLDLYNSIRKQIWIEGIPKEFVKKWSAMDQTQYSLTDNDITDFEYILNHLGFPKSEIYALFSSISDSRSSRDTNLSENNTQSITHNESDTQIPDIKDFDTFQKWILGQLDCLEESLK